MSAFVTAGGGFLLAVLWFDLMFDVQVIGHRGSVELPEAVLASISAYYARVTTAARPMNRLIAAVMVGTLAAIVVEIAHGLEHRWVAWVSLVLALGPIGLVGVRTVPSAVRLGSRSDPVAEQSALARAVLRQHLFCACSITALVLLQLAGV
jgi:hypothetical protein